jgi:hypothetical protein|tara:strand:+ start:272 stop:661 length:390 start_codon:yes stop_codon:yes gene_type:complete
MKKKKTNIKTIIRQMVREEVAMAIGEVVNELKQPTQQVSQPIKPVKKKSFSKNSVLNDILNETAMGDEWKTLGGGKLDSSQMNNVISQNYGDMMNSNPNAPVTVDGQTPDFLKKDYRALMKAVDKKQGR